MRRWLPVMASCLMLLGSLALPAPSIAKGPDAAVGVWVQRTHPAADVPGAKVVVTAARGTPHRIVLVGDDEGMDFADLDFVSGATSAQVVVTPVVPRGMHLASGGCDRVAYDDAATGEAPWGYVIRDGRVVVTLTHGTAASCQFLLAPGSPPETDTAPMVGRDIARAGPGAAVLVMGLLGGFWIGVWHLRTRSGRRRRGAS